MKDSRTNRGFEITEFKDASGAKCSLQKSSSAIEEKIWLGVDDADPKIMVSKAREYGLEPEGGHGWMKFPIPEDISLITRMHLNREQVKELLPYLTRFVETGNLHEWKHYEVWTEGYNATGNSQTATFHGKILAENFEQACIMQIGEMLDEDDSQPDGYERDSEGRMSVWGCRCFDNEADARKSFG